MLLQERFHGIVPVLSKWSGAIVGLTLIGIGVLGVYESLFQHEESVPVESVAMAGLCISWGCFVVAYQTL